jgi:hypothetical protein
MPPVMVGHYTLPRTGHPSSWERGSPPSPSTSSFALAGLIAELGLAALFLAAGGLLLLTALLGTARGKVRRED